MHISKLALSITLLILTCVPILQAATLPPPENKPPQRDIPPAPSHKIAPHLWETFKTQPTAEALLILTSQADVSAAQNMPLTADKAHFVYHTRYTIAQHTQAPLRAWLTSHAIPHRAYYIINAVWIKADQHTMRILAHRPDVAHIVANPQIAQKLAPASPAMPQTAHTPTGIEWGITQIGAPTVWAAGYTGQGIVVAGQDTGYDWEHPALKNAYRGWDGTTAAHDYNWHDAIHDNDHGSACGINSPTPCDDHSHGTHTMGTMLGDDGGSNQIGVAPGAAWISCRNMANGYGTPARYIECFEFFIAPYPVNGTPADGDPRQAPDLINNSWSCPPSEGCDTASLQATVDVVRAAGIMVISSASNYGSACSSVREPIALYENVYTIGATNSDDNIASFSSRGPVTTDGSQRLKPELSAPGVSTRSSVLNDNYSSKSGTSMASPHVAGAVALLWSAVPAVRGDIVLTQALLNRTAVARYSTQCGDPANTNPNNVYGWGRLDIATAVQQAQVNIGILTGTVQNGTGSPLSGATIIATDSNAVAYSTVTDINGTFTLTLISDTYRVTISAPAHTPHFTDVIITAAQPITLNVTLDCDSVVGVSFTWEPQEVWADEPIIFTGAVAQGATPITYTWQFSGTTTTIEGNPVTHSFPASAHTALMPHPIVLTVANQCSQATLMQPVSVNSPYPPCSPITGLTLTHTPAIPHAQQPVTFTAQVITGTPPLTYTWHFSDSVVIGNPVTHTFPAKAELRTPYTLTLQAVNPCSHNIITHMLQISNPYTPCHPIAGLSLTHAPPPLQAGQPVTFVGHIVSGTLPVTYTWHFSGTAPVVGNPVTHTFPAQPPLTTTHTLTLTAVNACSQQTRTQTLSVHNPPPLCAAIDGLAFIQQPATLTGGKSITLTANVITGTRPISYTWQINNSVHLQGNPIMHTLPTTGSAWNLITVVVTASNLCSTQKYTAQLTFMTQRVYLPLVMREGLP